MINYKNISYAEKTFHGVTFKPGEAHTVSEYINDPDMIVVPLPKEKPTSPEPAVKKKKEAVASDQPKEEIANG